MSIRNYIKITRALIICFGLFSTNTYVFSQSKVYLVQGENATEVEKRTVQDFQIDLTKVVNDEVLIISESEKLPKEGIVFLLGTIDSNKRLKKLSNSNKISLSNTNPGARGGIWSKVNLKKKREVIVLGGSDVQGFQYTVYDYSHDVLGIDPFEYWTGKIPQKEVAFNFYKFENRTIAPPLVPMMNYFENDVDELANYRGKLLEYDWESFTELINSLVRIRYNSIQFFDMLGRPEFFVRQPYKELSPNYQIDMDYLDKMIDYVHLKGMEVQIDLSLGYQIKTLTVEESYCWTEYKQNWIDVWKYYFEETPIGKADIFSLRPRHQVWDWEYISSCGEDKTTVFNEVYKELDSLIDHYKPDATKIAIIYHDGMEIFEGDFNPPKDWIAVWCDDGFGDFKHLPESTKGYNFGTYMHAGFWKNHTVHNPYPNKVEEIMKKMFNEYGADKYCQVNGQNFRPFLLNLEAYSEVCKDPENFDGDEFYKTWTERYFSKEAAKYAVESMKVLHKVQEGRNGYVQHLWEVGEAIAYLSNSPISMPGKDPVPSSFERVEDDIEKVKSELSQFQTAVDKAELGMSLNQSNQDFYYSYVMLPVKLYSDLITFERTIHKMAILKREFEETGDRMFIAKAQDLIGTAQLQLDLIHKHSVEGDKNAKWENFYNPKIRRPNNGFPSINAVEKIEQGLNTL